MKNFMSAPEEDDCGGDDDIVVGVVMDWTPRGNPRRATLIITKRTTPCLRFRMEKFMMKA